MKYTLLALLFSLISFGQTKKEILLDEHGKTISEATFKSKMAPPSAYFYTVSENDNSRIITLALRETSGKLEAGQREEIVQALKSLTGKDIALTETIIINFFFKENTTNQRLMIDHYTTDKAYARFLKRNSGIKQFSLTPKDYTYGKNGVIEDTTGTLQKLFPDEGSANYIIIRPNGSYLKRHGEYRQDEIPDKVKGNW